MSFKNAVLQYTYLTSICHIQNGVPELKMTNLMEWCGRNNGAQLSVHIGRLPSTPLIMIMMRAMSIKQQQAIQQRHVDDNDSGVDRDYCSPVTQI